MKSIATEKEGGKRRRRNEKGKGREKIEGHVFVPFEGNSKESDDLFFERAIPVR